MEERFREYIDTETGIQKVKFKFIESYYSYSYS